MPLSAVIGQATALEGREAALQATRQALEQLGKKPVVFGFVLASQYFPIQQVLSGIASLLGDAPLLGFSTNSEIASGTSNRRSVVVALLSGDNLQARADWWPGFSDDSRDATQKMVQALQLYQADGILLVVADGLNGDASQLCATLPMGNYNLAGCLAGGDIRRAQTSQIGGKKAGNGGLAAALLTGGIAMGVGLSHAWQPIGSYFTVTRARGSRVITLDDQPAIDTYVRLLGYQPQDWTLPPLNELVRLYPLGLEQDGNTSLLVRAPLRIEADGSLQMSTNIPEGCVVHLMVGSVEQCLQATENAAKQAMNNLGEAQPVLGLVFIDMAMQMLMEAQPGGELDTVRSVLGPNVPFVGGYTYGQIARTDTSGAPELFNQHIEVVVFGEQAA